MFFGWFIHRTICWICLFRIWQSELSFLSSKKTRSETFQNKKEIPLLTPLSHLFNSPRPTHPPPPPPPPLGPGLGSNCIVCAVLFLLLVVVRHFPHFLCLSLFLPVWKYPNALCNSICNMKAIQRAKMERSVGGWVGVCVCVSVCVCGVISVVQVINNWAHSTFQ